MVDIQNLMEIFMNEKACRSLLPYESEVVEFFYNKIEQHRVNVTSDIKIVKSIIELDIERVEYLLKEYILCRLHKLENNFFIDTTLLSSGEREFYEKYKKLFQEEDILDNEIEIKKHEDEVVGFICKDQALNIILDGEHIEIFQGDFFVTEMKNVFDLIKSKSIRLI